MALIGLKQLDSVLSGSLQVSGSAGVTGSLSVGGTLFGPADDHFDIKSDKDVRLYLDKDNDGTFHKFQVFNEDGDVKFAIASDGKSAIGAAVTSTSLDGLSVTGGITATGPITGSGNISGSATSTGSFGRVYVSGSNLSVAGGSLILGEDAYSVGANYVGLKTSFHTGSNDYMIISGKSDGSTYISAKDNSGVEIRGGGNRSNNSIIVPDDTYIKLGGSATTLLRPESDNSTDLGSAAVRYKDIHLAGDFSGSATSTGLFGNLRVESSILTINNGSVSGSATSTGSFGRVEANGVVYADSFESVTGGTTIDFNDDVSLIGNLTASAHISASGNITGSDIYSSGRIYEAGSSVIDHATAMAIVFGG